MNATPGTVDQHEISHFNTMSSEWWDKNSKLGPLHAMNELRVPLVRDGLITTGAVKEELVGTPKPLQGMMILEVGCGGGILTESLAKLGCTTVGIDLCPDLLKLAEHHAAQDPSLSNLQYVLESVEDHSINNSEKYDALVCSEVLEHVLEPKIFLEHCVKCLKPGGSIFITTVNKTVISLFLGIIFAEYIWGIVPRGTHQWNKFISPKETKEILKSYNCETRFVSGMLYNFINRKWHWASTTCINYGLHAVKN